MRLHPPAPWTRPFDGSPGSSGRNSWDASYEGHGNKMLRKVLSLIWMYTINILYMRYMRYISYSSKKKRCRNFVRKQLFISTKMMLLMIFFARAFCSTRNTPPVYWNNPWFTSKVPKSYSHRTKEDSTTNLTGENVKNTTLGIYSPKLKVRPWKIDLCFGKEAGARNHLLSRSFRRLILFNHPMFQGHFCCFQGG